MAFTMLAGLGLAVQGAGSILGGYAQHQQQRAIASAHRQNAELAIRIGGIREAVMRRQHRRQLGQMRATYGASGVQVEGTPMAVLSDQAMEAEIRSLFIRFEAERTAQGHLFAARMARAEGRAELLSGILGGAAAGARMGARALEG